MASQGKTLYLLGKKGDVEQKLSDSSDNRVLPLEKHADIAKEQDGTFDRVMAFCSLPFSPPFLKHVMRVLKSGGKLFISAPAAVADDVARSLLFGGFSDIKKEDPSDDGSRQVSCTSPSWKAGDSAPLKLASAPVKPKAAGGDVWNLADDDLADEDVDVVDEDALLSKEDDIVVVPTNLNEDVDDCGVSGKPSRKACKNCVCGRAEMEADDAPKDAPVSACGSCGLGDAFRCSTCPYLGQPAFASGDRPGDVVKLAL